MAIAASITVVIPQGIHIGLAISSITYDRCRRYKSLPESLGRTLDCFVGSSDDELDWLAPARGLRSRNLRADPVSPR